MAAAYSLPIATAARLPLARTPVHEVVAFIDAYRDQFGVEPICRVLTEHGCKIAPNTFWVTKKRPPSPRAVRDAGLAVEVRRVYVENLFVYGADKVWTQLNREGIRVARCTVERLMRANGLSGARRGKAFTITTARMTVSTGPRIWLNGTSTHRHRTDCGSPI